MAARGQPINPVLLARVKIVCDLINRDGVFFDLAVGAGGLGEQTHFHNFWVALVELNCLLQTQDHEPFVRQQADVAIVIEQRPPLFGSALQEVAAKKHGFAGMAQQTQNSRRDIQRGAKLRNPAWAFQHRRAGDEQGDLVGVDGNALLAVNPGSMVGNHHED